MNEDVVYTITVNAGRATAPAEHSEDAAMKFLAAMLRRSLDHDKPISIKVHGRRREAKEEDGD